MSPESLNTKPLLRSISDAAEEVGVPQHVLRFWETKFGVITPIKRAGGRRYYREEDIRLLQNIRDLLYVKGYTVRGVQKLFQRKKNSETLKAVHDTNHLDQLQQLDLLDCPQEKAATINSSVTPLHVVASNPPSSPAQNNNKEAYQAVMDLVDDLKELKKLITDPKDKL